jgi:predicted secreted protein
MTGKSIALAFVFAALCAAFVFAGDTASFADLGFSPDGKTYMFGQYGVESVTLRPWADVFLVDVPSNNFVAGGKSSFEGSEAVVAGQDGSGALYALVAKNAALAGKRGINYTRQGQPLYVAFENGVHAPGGETVEFRDFEKAQTFRAVLSAQSEGAGAAQKSSFSINLEKRGADGSTKTYAVGNPAIKRSGVVSYKIRKVVVAPGDGSLVFVIEMKKARAGGGYDIRYMVEALKL